jgi:hypothetical protein
LRLSGLPLGCSCSLALVVKAAALSVRTNCAMGSVVFILRGFRRHREWFN